MEALMASLKALSPAHDQELIEGYQRYAALLEHLLTPDQIELYAAMLQRSGLQIFADLPPAEIAALPSEQAVIATTIMADDATTMENRRVEALLFQRGAGEFPPKLEQRSVSSGARS